MAKRGRRAKSDAEKRLHGNPGRRPLKVVGDATAPAAAAPPTVLDPPECLTGEAAAEWRRVAPLLAAGGKLTPLDRATLVLYCQAWADWLEAQGKIATTGKVLTFRDDKGVVKSTQVSPDVTLALKLADKLRQLSADLGLNPSARGQLGGGPPEGEKKGGAMVEFLKLVGRKRGG